MATTSTIPAVKSALVDLLSVALDVPVTYAWPGPNTAHECVFLGRYPDVPGEDRIDATSAIANIVTGRKQRTETYTVPLTIWSFRPDLNSDGAAEAEERAFVMLSVLEDVLADDPKLGLDILWAQLGDYSSVGHPYDKGWVYELIAQVDVQARLL
jgi:hypothetical protein